MHLLVASLRSFIPLVRTNSKPITRYFFSVMTKDQGTPLVVYLGSTYGVPWTNYEQEEVVGIDDYRINYARIGNGAHALLLLPGALGTIQTDFKPQLAGLDKTKYTLVAWDPPGYGKSRPPERDFPKDFFFRDAIIAGKLMEKLGLEKYSILGWSDGGITGLIMADIYKKNVKKLISFAANAYITKADSKIMEGIRDVSAWSQRMRLPMEEVYGKEYFAKLLSAWVDAMLDIGQRNGGDICKSCISNITAPTLVIQGDKDPMVPFEHAKYLSENISNAKLHLFKDGKHNLHLRYPEQFNTLVDEFLSSP